MLYCNLFIVYCVLCVASTLQKELKAVDDKMLQAELHLVDSRTFYALGNVQKARGSLTAARTATSGIYCPPRLQAEFDLQAGTLCSLATSHTHTHLLSTYAHTLL